MIQKQTDNLKFILYTSPRTDQILAESIQTNKETSRSQIIYIVNKYILTQNGKKSSRVPS
jgi:predicted HTH transcriptional regulator